MGADFLTHHVPKKVHLKYVKEVLAGGLITSQYEQEGLKTQHQIIQMVRSMPKLKLSGKK